jgi:hypothetical protein
MLERLTMRPKNKVVFATTKQQKNVAEKKINVKEQSRRCIVLQPVLVHSEDGTDPD